MVSNGQAVKKAWSNLLLKTASILDLSIPCVYPLGLNTTETIRVESFLEKLIALVIINSPKMPSMKATIGMKNLNGGFFQSLIATATMATVIMATVIMVAIVVNAAYTAIDVDIDKCSELIRTLYL